MSRLIISFFVLLFVHNSWAQELYFVSGSPTPKSMLSFPTLLYKYNPVTEMIDTLKELIPAEYGTYFMHCYQDEKLLCMLGGEYLYILEFQRPLDLKRFELDPTNDCQYYQGYLVNNNENRYYCFRGANETLCTYNIQTGEASFLPIEELANAYVCGFPGTLLIGNFKNFRLKDGIVELGNYKFTEEFTLPSREAISYNSNTLYIPIDNDKMRVMHTHEEFEKNKNVKKLHVLNKSKDAWSTLEVSGNYSNVRAFNHWLVGYFAQRHDTKIREIPGKIKVEDRRKTGLPFNYNPILEDFELPGTLFLYDIDTDKKITIETNNEDSEILLIHDDTIYYRVGSIIYKAFIEGNEVTNAEEFASAKFVPDIHWAFMN